MGCLIALQGTHSNFEKWFKLGGSAVILYYKREITIMLTNIEYNLLSNILEDIILWSHFKCYAVEPNATFYVDAKLRQLAIHPSPDLMSVQIYIVW